MPSRTLSPFPAPKHKPFFVLCDIKCRQRSFFLYRHQIVARSLFFFLFLRANDDATPMLRYRRRRPI